MTLLFPHPELLYPHYTLLQEDPLTKFPPELLLNLLPPELLLNQPPPELQQLFPNSGQYQSGSLMQELLPELIRRVEASRFIFPLFRA